jgi:hypothetical protein
MYSRPHGTLSNFTFLTQRINVYKQCSDPQYFELAFVTLAWNALTKGVGRYFAIPNEILRRLAMILI